MNIVNYSKNFNSTKSFQTIIFIILFTPSFFGYLGLGTGQLVLLFILLLTMLCVGLYSGRLHNLRLLSNIIVSFLCLSFLYAISIALSSISIDNPSFKDFFDIFRPILYLSYFIISYSLIRANLDLKSIITYFCNCMIAMTVFDILKFNPEFFNLMRLYTVFNFGEINYIRFQGTFCFCYNYGFLMLFALALVLYNKTIKGRWLYISLFSIFIIATGSRSVIAGYFVQLFLFLFFYRMSILKKTTAFLFVLLFFIFTYISVKDVDLPIIKVTIGYVERMVDSLISGESKDGSLNARNSQLDKAFEAVDINPLFGIGPQKGTGEPIEIMFGYYISSWGILGLFCYIYILFCLFYYAYRSSSSSDYNISSFSKANMLWLVGVVFVGMSTPIIDQVRVANIFYMFQAIQFFYFLKYKKQTIDEKNNRGGILQEDAIIN